MKLLLSPLGVYMKSKGDRRAQTQNHHELFQDRTQEDNHRLVASIQDPIRCLFLKSSQHAPYLTVIVQETALLFAKTV